MTDEKRWIIVSDGTAQTMYAGKTILGEVAIDDCIKEGLAIELAECRALRTILMPMPNGAIALREMVTPIGFTRGGVRMSIKPTAYLWPHEDEKAYPGFLEALKTAEENETRQRIEDAGLSAPGGARIAPGGRLVQ